MILQCTQCDKIYRGHETTDDRIVPHGVTACQECGSETFSRLTLADLGLD
jgi:predicted  nucleic acid-binding Zn-ribbon protein